MLSKLLKLCFIALIFFFITLPVLANEKIYFSYDEFIEKVKNGNIISVELEEFSEIKGIYNNKHNIAFHTYHEDPNNDILLLDLLRSKNIKIEIKKDENLNPLFQSIPGLTMLFIPILTLILIIYLNIKVNRIIKGFKNT